MAPRPSVVLPRKRMEDSFAIRGPSLGTEKAEEVVALSDETREVLGGCHNQDPVIGPKISIDLGE
jgi:hypothetical protein